jgi:hypothetical protein
VRQFDWHPSQRAELLIVRFYWLRKIPDIAQSVLRTGDKPSQVQGIPRDSIDLAHRNMSLLLCIGLPLRT